MVYFRQVFLRLASLAILIVSLYIQITCNTQNFCLVGTGDCPAIQVRETVFYFSCLITEHFRQAFLWLATLDICLPNEFVYIYHLSYDGASESVVTSCIKNGNPLVD